MQINENAQTTSSYVQNPFLHTYLALKSIEETKFEVLKYHPYKDEDIIKKYSLYKGILKHANQ